MRRQPEVRGPAPNRRGRLAVTVAVAVAGSLVALGACGSTAERGGSVDREPTVVASTNVYGDIARTIAGDHARVTAIIDDPGADPHDYEASTRDLLAVSHADIVIVNGGGYDDFMQTLRHSAGNPDARVLDAVAIAHRPAPADGEFNEHVWYDLAAMASLAERLRDALVALDPAHAADYRANTATFTGELRRIEHRAQRVGSAHPDATVAMTEPVPLALLATMGLDNRTPDAFSEAVEEGEEASPAVLAETLELFPRDAVDLAVVNTQTSDGQTDEVIEAAHAHHVPVVSVTETLPAHESYLTWMRANVDAIAAALAGRPAGSRAGS